MACREGDTLMPSAQTPRLPKTPFTSTSRRAFFPERSPARSTRRNSANGEYLERSSSRLGPPPAKLQKYPMIKKADPYAGTYMEHAQVAVEVLQITHKVEREDPSEALSTVTNPSESISSTSSIGHISVFLSPKTSRLRHIPAVPIEQRNPFTAWIYVLLYMFPPQYDFEVVTYEATGTIIVNHTMRHEKGAKKWSRKVEMLVVRCYTGDAAKNLCSSPHHTSDDDTTANQQDVFQAGTLWITSYLRALHTGVGWDTRNGPRSPAPHVWAAVAVGDKVKFHRWVQKDRAPRPTGLLPLNFLGKSHNLTKKEPWHLERDCVAIDEILRLIDDGHWA